MISKRFTKCSLHFSPGREMIAPGFGFTRDFTTEWNTLCISEGVKFLVDSKNKRGLVYMVRYAG